MKRIGVFAGAFDPIHLGHTSFIDSSIKDKSLDEAHILIEQTSPHKKMLASYGDRIKMARIALASEPKAKIIEQSIEQYPISNYLPTIKNPQNKIYLLIGKDVLSHIKTWEGSDKLLEDIEIVVANRDETSQMGLVSSLKIREKLNQNQKPIGLDGQVLNYILENKLYL